MTNALQQLALKNTKDFWTTKTTFTNLNPPPPKQFTDPQPSPYKRCAFLWLSLESSTSFCDKSWSFLLGCTWAWTWVATSKRKASLRPRKVCGCRSLERGRLVGRGAMDVAALCRRCDWSKLDQCIDFFQKQGAIRGPNEMEKDFQNP